MVMPQAPQHACRTRASDRQTGDVSEQASGRWLQQSGRRLMRFLHQYSMINGFYVHRNQSSFIIIKETLRLM
jgi:hypothetical protein